MQKSISTIIIVSLAVFYGMSDHPICLSAQRPHCGGFYISGDFQFWDGQEEEIYRGYLQIASYIREKEREQQASGIGEDMRARVLSLPSARSERMQQMATRLLD